MTQASLSPTAERPLPRPLDSETLALLRTYLRPIFDQATGWDDLGRRLASRGHGIAFRDGRLVVLNDRGDAVCTGRCLGVPLRTLAARLGRAHVRADRSGRMGTLH